jgi:polyisoprenoid-binding protein YceI
VAGVLGLPEDGERNGNGDPRRIAGRPQLLRVRPVSTLIVLLLAALACSAQAAPRSVQFGPPESEVAFRAYGLGLLPIDARFARFDGWLTYDPDDRLACRVELNVQVASLLTDDASLRGTMVGTDFMDADRFPVLTYFGSCDSRGGLEGMLAMHGVTRPFALSLDWGRDRVVAEGRLLRADWGMTAMPLIGGRTVRIRVAVPLAGGREQSSHPASPP